MIEKLAIVKKPIAREQDRRHRAADQRQRDEQRQQRHLRADEHAAGAPAVDQPAADQRARRRPQASMIVSAALPAAFESASSATKYAGMNACRPK